MVFERLISHSFDYLGGLRQEFFPTSIRVYLSKQYGPNRLLLVFGEFLRNRVGFIKKVAHSRHSNP